MVPVAAADVMGISTHEITPAFVSKLIAPISRLSSCVRPVATTSPENVEVAVVDVAWKYSATTGPTTDSFAYGDVVPMPTFPLPVMTNRSVVPRAVDEAIAKRPLLMSYPIVHCPALAPENESAAFVAL